jgi:hypothetical protein
MPSGTAELPETWPGGRDADAEDVAGFGSAGKCDLDSEPGTSLDSAYFAGDASSLEIRLRLRRSAVRQSESPPADLDGVTTAIECNYGFPPVPVGVEIVGTGEWGPPAGEGTAGMKVKRVVGLR